MVATIAHPTTGEQIPVEITDEESHRGEDMVKVEAISPNTELTDGHGNDAWLFAESVEQ